MVVKSIHELQPSNVLEKKALDKAIKKGIDIGVKCFVDNDHFGLATIVDLYFVEDDGYRILNASLQSRICLERWNCNSNRFYVIEEQTHEQMVLEI